MPQPSTPAPADPALDEVALRRLPKVLLHEHLDGGLAPATLLALLRQRGIEPPAAGPEALAAWFAARAHTGNLVDYLRGFEWTLAAMAGPDAMARVAFEAAEAARAQGCVLAEFRMAPLLLETPGLPAEQVVEALLAGLARSPLPSGLILCAMRQEPAERSLRVLHLAQRYRDAGVVGLDLAGPEAGHPAADHAATLAAARAAGLPLTLHAGEADGPHRVEEAVAHGARRIGHGVRLAEWLGTPEGRDRLAALRARGIHLEVCLTSNVQTGAAASLAAHPVAALWRFGFSLSYHTDNPLISATTLSREAALLRQHQGLGRADLLAMARQAALHSFLPEPARTAALARIDDAEEGR